MWREYVYKGIIIFCLAVLSFIALNINIDLWTVRRNFEPVKYQSEIDKYAEQFSLEPELLAAIIYVESRFDSASKSSKGAVGLMQLMPSTAVWIADKLEYNNFNLEDLTKPELNIEFGSWYFAYLYHKFDKNLIKAIAAYNAGEKNVRKWIAEGWDGDISQTLPFSETDNFVRRVISTKDYYKENNLKIFSISSFNILFSNLSE